MCFQDHQFQIVLDVFFFNLCSFKSCHATIFRFRTLFFSFSKQFHSFIVFVFLFFELLGFFFLNIFFVKNIDAAEILFHSKFFVITFHHRGLGVLSSDPAIGRLCESGKQFILVSHRLEKMLQICLFGTK